MRALVVAVVVLLVAAGCAITPSVPYQRTTFEGLEVIAHVPERPRGLVFLFHGTGGSASFAERVETTDVLNRVVAQGYGFVSTSSTERTGDRRWNVLDASTTSNPDLARLGRLRTHLIATTPVEAATPLVGIGTSNGARFVTLWGQAWRNAGLPVRAIWASMGTTAPAFAAPGALTVPTVFSTAENDFTVPPSEVVADHGTARDAGTPTEVHVSRERPLSAPRFERIPGVDPTEAGQVRDALVATGVWNARGVRVEPDIQAAASRAQTVTLPASVRPHRGEIINETALQLAVHQFTAEFADRLVAFFARFVPTT